MAIRFAIRFFVLSAFACALAACAGSRQANPVPGVLAPASEHFKRNATAVTSSGMCSIYSGFGALSFCYDFDEASGTTLVDASSAGHDGTISSTGVTYGASGLAGNSTSAETTDGTTGSMKSGFDPATGSFSITFFVNLRSNKGNWQRLVETGNPTASGGAQTGFYIAATNDSNNYVWADMGYGSGNSEFGYISVPLNTPTSITLTYDATTDLGSICAGSTAKPTCVTKTLPAAYVASGSPVVFGGGAKNYPANATFDEAGYFQGTALTSAQVDTIAGYTGTGASPVPTPSPTSGMCSTYAGLGALSFCYDFDDASGTTLHDSSSAANNGTISSTGVAYHATGLTTNSSFAEAVNGTTGSMTSGYTPTSGSFSLSFFVDLASNPNNWSRLIETADPPLGNETGMYVAINKNATNSVWVDLGYGTGDAAFGYISLPLNTPTNITVTYNASTLVGTICVGTTAPTCVNKTLPAAYVASGAPIVFGGGTNNMPANGTFDEAAYFNGTVLTTAQIGKIAAFATASGGTSPTPVPTVSPSPQPTASVTFNDWTSYMYDSAHDGFNPNTTAFTPTSVGKLHLAWQTSVNPSAQAQPIVATNIAGHAALLLIGSYYGMNAYDGMTGTKVWGPVTLGEQDLNQCTTLGVSGTPIYDAALGVIFVAAGDGGNPSHVVVYKLSVATGSIISQVDITPALLTGETTSGHTSITFANGRLYIGTGSNCENSSWRGRVVAVDPVGMTLLNTFYMTYNQGGTFGGGGIWSWGGVSSDANGNIYAAGGNAETTTTTNGTIAAPFESTTDEQAGFAEHIVKLTSDLSTVEDSNYPTFNFTVGMKDLDFAGTPVVFQPDGCDPLTATQGKGGTLVINDTTNMANPIQYTLSMPSARANYMGNPGYSPLTQLLYAPVNSSEGGSLFNPGMAAIGGCGKSIVWNTVFGPDSFTYSSGSNPRSGPTVTAGGVVFMGTPAGTSSAETGSVWALDATSGSLLGGGNPILNTAAYIRMAPTVDGLWMWVFDHSGNLYGMTIDPSVPSVQVRPGIHKASLFKYPE